MSVGGPGEVPSLQVLVVAYGECPGLPPALERLGGTYPVTLVDNSSEPATRRLAERLAARYLDPGENLGFAGGVNLGLRSLPPGADVLLLNPDASIGPEGVEQLLEALRRDPRAACAAPAQHAPGAGAQDRVCWPFPSPGGSWLEAFGAGRLRRRADFVIGSVLLLRGQALEDVGPFDEGYFLYAEETDWQLRARRRGWTVAYCPDAEATHVGAGTGGDPVVRERHFHTSQARFVRKWYGPVGFQAYRAAELAGGAVRAILLRGEARRAAAHRVRLYGSGPAGRPPRRRGERGLRVLQVVCTDAFAGVERYVVSLSTGLVGLGCEVVVVGGDPAQMPIELTPAGVSWHRGAGVLGTAARLCTLGRFDLVHAHMTEAETAVALASPWLRAPVVATRHFARRRGSTPGARVIGRLLTRVVDEQLAISDYVAGAVEGHAVVVRPGVADVEDEARGDERELVVLMLQRLEAEKRVDVGLRAFAASGLGKSGWQLRVVGGGAERAALAALAEELGISGSCELVGPRVEVASLYRGAGIFLATRPDEPLGLSVLEAMAHGLPVVAAGGGGHLETVGRCARARLFPPGDVQAAAGQLVALAGSARERAEYGAALRRLQQEELSVERQVLETLAVYRHLVR